MPSRVSSILSSCPSIPFNTFSRAFLAGMFGSFLIELCIDISAIERLEIASFSFGTDLSSSLSTCLITCFSAAVNS